MAFDFTALEIDRVVVYKEIEYRVVDQTGSGLLSVVKEEDVVNKNYPLVTYVIPDPFDFN